MKKLPIFYSALVLTAVNLLLRLVSTSFQVFVSGRIGAAGVGLLQLVLSVGMFANTAATAGIRTTAMYLTAEELGKNRPHNVSHVLTGCFRYSILCSAGVSAVLFLFAVFYIFQNTTPHNCIIEHLNRIVNNNQAVIGAENHADRNTEATFPSSFIKRRPQNTPDRSPFAAVGDPIT